MANPNISPRFCKEPAEGSCLVSAANTRSDGVGTIGTDIFLLKTADAEGNWIDTIRVMVTAAASTTSTQTMMRFYKSSASSGATTSANTHLIGEINIPSMSVGQALVQVLPIDLPVDDGLAAGMSILCSSHNAPAANTGYKVTLVRAGAF